MNKRSHLVMLGFSLALIISLILIVSITQPRTKTWCYTTGISGEGDWVSSTFTMQNPWRIKWSYTDNPKHPELSFFGAIIYVKTTMGWPWCDVIYSKNSTEGILTMNRTGNFYLEVLAFEDDVLGATSWELIIEEWIE